MFNILAEALIRMDTAKGLHTATLPSVYPALMADEVEAFPALRPHQRHAWHAFLVQLGAMAMHRAGRTEPPEDAETWSTLIRGLTPDYPADEPWQLVVDDITKPAFMQPPARSKERETDYKSAVETPDDLDVILMSKNHDLKSEVAAQAGAGDWVFALITLQTMEGFSGAGNYGISRMNGGLGSRAAFTLAPSARLGTHVRRDILALLGHRSTLLAEFPMTDAGESLLWTTPWDGTAGESLTASRLDPYYIEVCRRIRLSLREDGTLYGIRASSKAARVEGKDLKGRTGDPWVPVNRKRDNLPLTLAAGGFTYKRVTEYLSADWGSPLLLRPRPSEQNSSETRLVARAMVRGQGKTEGYHERVIPLRPRTVRLFGSAGGTQEFGDIARQRIEQVDIVQRILSHGIQVFAARGKADAVSPEHRTLARPWLNKLDEIVDRTFFEDLQTEFEADDDASRQDIRREWLLNDNHQGVIDHARSILYDAEDAMPCPAICRYRARVNAEGLFEGRLRGSNGLPFLFLSENEDDQ